MEENQVYIPEGWISKQVQEFAIKMRSGGTPKSDNPKYYNGDIPFVAIDDLTSANKYLERTQKRITKEGLNNSAAWIVPLNTIMYSIYATLGVPRINLIEAATNQAILNIIPNESKITLEFLYYLLLEKRSSILAHSAHTTQSNLNAKIVKELEFVFPKNPKEQTKIATILSKVDEAIARTEQLIAKYTRIKTGLMQDLLTKGIDENGNIRSEATHEFKDSPLGRIPKEWDCVNFGENIELVHGYQFRNYDFTETGTPVVKIGQVKENGLDLLQCSFINPNRAQLFAKQTINNGDVLMALTGATLGKACIVSGLNSPVLQNYRVGRFEPIFVNDVDKTFLFYTLKSSLFLGQIFNNVNEAAQGNVGKSDFKKSFFIKPPFVEQLKIVQHIEKIFNLVDYFNLELNKYQSLKTGLMQDLLSGKVRVNHLIKETASV